MTTLQVRRWSISMLAIASQACCSMPCFGQEPDASAWPMLVYGVNQPGNGDVAGERMGYASMIASLPDLSGIFITAKHVVEQADKGGFVLVSKSGKVVKARVAYEPTEKTQKGVYDWALVISDPTPSGTAFGVDATAGKDSSVLTASAGLRNGFDTTSPVLQASPFSGPAVTAAKEGSQDEQSASPNDVDLAILRACHDQPQAIALHDFNHGDSGSALLAKSGAVLGIATEFAFTDDELDAAATQAFSKIYQGMAQAPKDDVTDLTALVAAANATAEQRKALSDLLAKNGVAVVIPMSCMMREFAVEAIFKKAGDLEKLPLGDSVKKIKTLEDLNTTFAKQLNQANVIDVLQFLRLAVNKYKDKILDPSNTEERRLFTLIIDGGAKNAGIEEIIDDILERIKADVWSRNSPDRLINQIAGLDAADIGNIIANPEKMGDYGIGATPSVDPTKAMESAQYFTKRARDVGSNNPELALAATKLALADYAVAVGSSEFANINADQRSVAYNAALDVLAATPGGGDLKLSVQTELASLGVLAKFDKEHLIEFAKEKLEPFNFTDRTVLPQLRTAPPEFLHIVPDDGVLVNKMEHFQTAP